MPRYRRAALLEGSWELDDVRPLDDRARARMLVSGMINKLLDELVDGGWLLLMYEMATTKERSGIFAGDQ